MRTETVVSLRIENIISGCVRVWSGSLGGGSWGRTCGVIFPGLGQSEPPSPPPPDVQRWLQSGAIRLHSQAEYENHFFGHISLDQLIALHLLSGVKRFCPNLRLKVPTAAQYFRNWQRIYQPVRATPVSLELIQAMAAVAWKFSAPLAFLLLLGFAAMLRTQPGSRTANGWGLSVNFWQDTLCCEWAPTLI